MKEEERTCKVCNLNRIEDERHFLFSCAPLQLERSSFYVDTIKDIGEFMLLDVPAEIRMLIESGCIKKFDRYVEQILHKRQSILYKPTA